MTHGKLGKVAALGVALCATATVFAPLASAAAHHKAVPAHKGPAVQISFWYGIGGQLGQDVQMLVKKFNATHPGVHVTATYEGSYSGGGPEQQHLLAAIRAGNAPDIAQMEVHSMPVFASAGRLLNLTRLMEKSAWDKPADFLPGMLVSTNYKGAYYGVPFNRSVPVLMYNETMFKKAHIAHPPATWAQVMADAKILTHGKGRSKVWGFMPLVDWWPWEASVWSGGGHIMNKSLTKATFASAAGERVLNMEEDLIKQGYAMVQTGPEYWDETTEAFAHGQTAMDIDSPGDTGEVAGIVGHKFQWNEAMFPADATRLVPPGGGNAVMLASIPKNHIAGAWTFIQWWTAPAQSALWSELTGYVPVQKAVLSEPAFKTYLRLHPQYDAAIAELKYQHQPPQSPQYLSLLQYVQNALQGALDLGQPINKSMLTAQNQVNSELSG